MVSIKDIKIAFDNFQPRTLSDDGSKRGAVLIPIFERKGELYILFTKRTEELPTHKGQISFPGGKKEEKDESLLGCALRETYEEIGLPADKFQILGELNQTKTTSSNFLLSAFVGKLSYPFELNVNKQEVQEILEVPLNEFLQEESWKKSILTLDGEKIEIWFFHYRNHIIWGATALLLRELITIINKIS
ncbi:MAG TPA: CoA pyrophosphatase [candidate division Zixibacteria bacterium]|nr:CoA pyrophosphatase [candidate division Zixibacteria bacterium]